ncbi:MAG: adenosine kinase, partial [Candidatus Pacebacteria bacterium]|nr:adenosine kinase [Candidatus Paceibacterota bacterium]
MTASNDKTQPSGVVGVGSALVDHLAFVPDDFLAGIHGAKGGMELIDRAEMVELLGRLPEI